MSTCNSWQSWDNIISYIKDEVGADVMALEISDQKIMEKIQMHVMPEFSNYDPLVKYYKMTTGMIVTRDPISVYQFKNFDYKIMGINSIIEQANYVDYSQMFSQAIAGDITDFLVRQNYLDMASIAKADNTWKFLPPDKIQMVRAGYSYLSEEFIVVLNVAHNDPISISPALYDSFRDLATAYIMNVIAKIRKKFNNFNTPFGQIQLNADELIQDSKELRMRTLEELKKTPPDSYIWVM